MKKIFDEFKAFALKGSMIDLAVGIIIGASFNKVVASLVNDILLPPLGLLIGGVDFSELSLPMKWPGSTQEPVLWNIGAFIGHLIDFFLVACAIFLVVKMMNTLRKKKEPGTKDCSSCLMAIPKKAKKCRYCCTDQ